MKTQINIFVAGSNGRMGKEIIRLVIADGGLYLAGASEHHESPVLGADAGLNAGSRQVSVSITTDLKRAFEKFQSGVVIDFSTVASTLENIKRAETYNIPLVIGTTGFNAAQTEAIHKVAQKVPVVFSPNMAVGVNVFLNLVAKAAGILNENFDPEIFEVHHRDKIDAPSGTALKIAETVCVATGRKFPQDVVLDRSQTKNPRERREVGVQSLRGGDVVGDHTITFFGNGERVEIRHVATSRNTFASGAILAAKWVVGKAPGLYGMADVLGLK